jgi:hypothetical protein
VEELTFDQKLEKMTEAIEIERSRLYAIGQRPAARALAEILDHPVSVVRLYDILTLGAGNA